MTPHDPDEMVLPEEIAAIGRRVIGCAIEVHRRPGPGLLERLYEDAMCHEMELPGLRVARQAEVTIPYREIVLRGRRVDPLVEGSVTVELNALSTLHEIHPSQLLSYLRATDPAPGYLFNFNVTPMRDGIRRVCDGRSSRCRSSSPSSPSSPLS